MITMTTVCIIFTLIIIIFITIAIIIMHGIEIWLRQRLGATPPAVLTANEAPASDDVRETFCQKTLYFFGRGGFVIYGDCDDDDDDDDDDL